SRFLDVPKDWKRSFQDARHVLAPSRGLQVPAQRDIDHIGQRFFLDSGGEPLLLPRIGAVEPIVPKFLQLWIAWPANPCGRAGTKAQRHEWVEMIGTWGVGDQHRPAALLDGLLAVSALNLSA